MATLGVIQGHQDGHIRHFMRGLCARDIRCVSRAIPHSRCASLCWRVRGIQATQLTGSREIDSRRPDLLKGDLETARKLIVLDDERGQPGVTSHWIDHRQHDGALVDNAQLHW